MKHSLVFSAVAVLLSLPTLGSATPVSMSWNFLNDVPAHSTGVSVGSTHSFLDMAGDSTSITASVSSGGRGYNLFEVNQGAMSGLGMSPEFQNEITAGQPGILLSLANVLALDPTTISISLNGINGSEAGTITYMDGDHGFNAQPIVVRNSDPVSLNLAELREDGGSILVGALEGNFLIGNITATTTPEPATGALLGLGVLGAWLAGRKHLGTQP